MKPSYTSSQQASSSAPDSTPDIDSIDHRKKVEITEDSGAYKVFVKKHQIQIPKERFGLLVQDSSNEWLIQGINASINVNEQRYNIGAPSIYTKGDNWVELRGWFDKSQHLWYIARFRFWPDQPFIHLALSLMDRHDNHPTEAHWSSEWDHRIFQGFTVSVATGQDLGSSEVVQYNSFSGGRPGQDPLIVEHTGASTVHWEQHFVDFETTQLIHDYDNSGDTWVKVYPRYSGSAKLLLHQYPLTSPYPAANAVTIIVHHASGTSTVTVDQGESENTLGRFTLDVESYVEIQATGTDGDRVVFQTLVLRDGNQTIKTVEAQQVADPVLTAGNYGLVVKDFWQKHPIRAAVDKGHLITQAVLEPTKFVGGAGITLDIGINFDHSQASNAILSSQLDLPPEPTLPDWWHPLDGQISQNASYMELLNQTRAIIYRNDKTAGNYGWKNWGDYQIGHSYRDGNGLPVEDWGALQYDLGLGLMLAWMNTGDPWLWNRARAGVRNIMDIQVAKFEPYAQKRSGAGLRKGACNVQEAHWCQEPIPEFNYHTRSLLLYAHLTGEQWPKEVAHMLIDNSAYFSWTRPEWTISHARIISWSLRNLYYGAKLFPEGTKYLETPEGGGWPQMSAGTSYVELLNTLTNHLVTEIETLGRLPGDQPVWQAQIIEGLIIALDSQLLNEPLNTRTYNAIVTATNYFTQHHIRSDGNGGFEMLYSAADKDWTNAAGYGWFWLNNLIWVSRNSSSDHEQLHTKLYNWLQPMYRDNGHYQSTRAWSGVLAFPSYSLTPL